MLLLDVDGPLNPFAAEPEQMPAGYALHRLVTPGWEAMWRQQQIDWDLPAIPVKPLPVWLDLEHGARLSALPFELVWATTWEQEANTYIAPLLGLPQLPVIVWEVPRPERSGDGVFWKTPEIVAWAAGRAFAWVDDDITEADREWVRRHHAGPALLHRVDPGVGLTGADFVLLEEWAGAVGSGS